MMHDFLAHNRAELIARCKAKVARRPHRAATEEQLRNGIPIFLEQLQRTLEAEEGDDGAESIGISGAAGGDASKLSEIGVSATAHGKQLLELGFTVDQVVHDYGDLCQAITDLAFERDAAIGVDEFRTLNRCLDNAIAGSVAEFTYRRDLLLEDAGVHALNERLGFLAHELRNLIQTATLAVTAIKAGNVGLAGATGGVLDRSLIGLRNLVDRSLADVRVSAGMPARLQRISLARFIGEVKISASLEAQARGCGFAVAVVDPGVAIEVDRELMFSAVGNLLQNAFKFTEQHSEVSLRAYARGDRVLIDVEDECGGLPPGDAESLFLPFAQGGADRSGLGLGLSICRRSVEANHGVLRVRNVPGTGCVFSIDLPRCDDFGPAQALHS